jgi:hypothetical protein
MVVGQVNRSARQIFAAVAAPQKALAAKTAPLR